MTRSQEFIEKYKRVLETGPDYYNVDSAYMKLSEFNKRKKKFLLIFPTPALTKAVSATVNVINDMFCSEMPDWAFDVAYLPTKKDIELYDKCNMPYAIGEISHLDASHFDMVGFSVAVLHEVLTVPVIMKSFQRCDKPIPLTWTERKDLPLGEVPIFMCGGITASHGDIMFGELGDGRQAYLDMMCLGICDSTKWVCQDLLTTKAATNQEFIEECLKYPSTYHPQAYKVVYKDNLIVENTKINSKAPDFVQPYYPKFIPNRLGVGRTIIRSFGSNAGDTQIQLSESCTGGRGTCNFCAEGNYSGAWQEDSIENIRKHALETKKWTAAVSCKPLSFNALPDYTLIPTGGKFKRLSEISEDDKLINTRTDEAGIVGIAIAQPKEHFRFRLDRGPAAVMSKDHRQVIATAEGLKTVQANEIKVGDYIPYLVGYYKDQDIEFSEKHFFAGLWYGDGYLSGRNKRAYQAVACHESELVKFVSNSEFVDREVTTRDGIRHFLYTEEFGAFVKYLFPDYKYSDNNLTSLTVSEAISFIRGWFNADGSVSYRNSVLDVHLTGSAKELQVLEWASTVLMSVGINNKVSAPVRVSLSGYDKTHVRYDLYVRTRVSERLVCGWFVEPLKNTRVSMALRDNKRSSSDLIPPFVGKWMSKNYPRVSGANDCNFWSGLKAMSAERMEGKYASLSGGYLDMIRKGWRFAKVEEITDEGVLPCRDVLESDDHMYLTGFGLTHNCNHMKDFTNLIYVLNEAFPKVTYINMRLEELAQDTEAISMMRYTGASRLSAPIEGLSERIRNGFLNKNLSTESIEKLLHFMVGQRVTDIKVGLVWTGFENEEDWKEMRELVSRLKAEAASLNRKLPFRLKATALVYYPGTPLEIAERVTSRISYEGKRYFSDEMYEKNKEAGIHIKINGFRGSTFIEQAIVDLGGSITHWVQKYLVEPGIVCYNMRPIADPERFPSFKKLITSPEKYFAARKVDSYISPYHRIRLSLEGGIYSAQRKLENDWFDKEPTGKCLYTYEGCKTKCFKKGIKNRPYIHYADVKLVNGHLVGTNPEKIEGCNYCETPQEMKEHHLKREWKHSYSVADLQAQVVTRNQVKYRFLLRRLEDYAILNPHYTAFASIACLLRNSDSLLSKYWELKDHSLYNQMDPELVYEISGFQVIDVVFKEECLQEIKEAINKANEELQSSQFTQVIPISMEEKLSVNDYNVYHFVSKNTPLEAFINGKATYKGNIRVLSNVDMQAKVTQQQDKSLVYPFFKRTSNGVEGYFALPRRYNPFLFFQEVLSEKKYTQKAIQQNVRFEIVMPLQINSYAHCKCGSPVAVSTITGKTLTMCPNCVAKQLTLKLK